MTDLRSGIVTVLRTGLGGSYKVTGYPTTLTGITAPTVAVWPLSLEPLDSAPSRFKITYQLQVFTGHEDPVRADDQLDKALSDVLSVLWHEDGYLLDRADRTVSEDNKIHSWTLAVSAGLELQEM